MYCDFVKSLGFVLSLTIGITLVNLVDCVDYYDSNYPVRTGSELHVSYGAPTRSIGQHPNCGETPDKFDRLCCEEGRKRLDEEVNSLRRRGMDADVPSLVWLPANGQAPASCYINYSVHANRNKAPSSIYGRQPGEGEEEQEPECYRFRSKEECCSANASHRTNPCRWYTTQRKCAKAMKSEQKGPFGITLKTTQRCS